MNSGRLAAATTAHQVNSPISRVHAHGVRIEDPHELLDVRVTGAAATVINVNLTRQRHTHCTSHPALWCSEPDGPGVPSRFRLYRQSDQSHLLTVACQGRGSFLVTDRDIDVLWAADGTPPTPYLLGFGLAVLLERRGIPALHGAALGTNAGAIVLLGESQSGKSTLACAMMNAGATLLSEDMVALHREHDGRFRIHPCPDDVRLWPDSAAHFARCAPVDSMPRVHAGFDKRRLRLDDHLTGTPASAPLPLKAVLILDPNGTEQDPFSLVPLSPVTAITALLRHAMLGSAPRSLAAEEERLLTLAACTEQVSIHALHHPRSYVAVEATAARVLEALDA